MASVSHQHDILSGNASMHLLTLGYFVPHTSLAMASEQPIPSGYRSVAHPFITYRYIFYALPRLTNIDFSYSNSTQSEFFSFARPRTVGINLAHPFLELIMWAKLAQHYGNPFSCLRSTSAGRI